MNWVLNKHSPRKRGPGAPVGPELVRDMFLKLFHFIKNTYLFHNKGGSLQILGHGPEISGGAYINKPTTLITAYVSSEIVVHSF